jgi:hypothetical protein
VNNNRTLWITVGLCLVGALFFMFQRGWIIVQFTFMPTFQPASAVAASKDATYQKEVRLYYWKEDKWHYETTTIVWNEHNDGQNLRQMAKQWLVLLSDEHVLPFQVGIESVALSSTGGEAYVSFNRSLFIKDWSIQYKWQILNRLFKTIRYAMPSVQTISLLVHNRPMEDDHIECTYPLPVEER